jgi:hypothetical protein
MRQDKIVARILLIFSVANIALAAPVVVRQRHLDVARAAPQKRGPISDNEETGDSPPESSSPMPPHDGLTNGGGRVVFCGGESSRIVGAGFGQRGNGRFAA